MVTYLYRGDSWVCAAAVHAGVVDDGNGGCGRVELSGQGREYAGARGGGGLRSIPFDSYFPLSFTVSEEPALVACPGESQGALLLVSLFFTATLSLLTTSPLLLFVATLADGFVHVAFVSDPPEPSFHNVSVLPDRMSKFARRLLPAAFCLAVLYKTCVRQTLVGLDAQFEKTLLWLGGFWFGALSNYTLDWIPIQRLTTHDLEQQPGAKASLVVIVALLTLIAAQQIYYFWLEGRLLGYLALYGLFLSGIFVALLIPSINLRNPPLHFGTAAASRHELADATIDALPRPSPRPLCQRRGPLGIRIDPGNARRAPRGWRLRLSATCRRDAFPLAGASGVCGMEYHLFLETTTAFHGHKRHQRPRQRCRASPPLSPVRRCWRPGRELYVDQASEPSWTARVFSVCIYQGRRHTRLYQSGHLDG